MQGWNTGVVAEGCWEPKAVRAVCLEMNKVSSPENAALSCPKALLTLTLPWVASWGSSGLPLSTRNAALSGDDSRIREDDPGVGKDGNTESLTHPFLSHTFPGELHQVLLPAAPSWAQDSQSLSHINHPAQFRQGKAIHAEQQSLGTTWVCAFLPKRLRETSSDVGARGATLQSHTKTLLSPKPGVPCPL